MCEIVTATLTSLFAGGTAAGATAGAATAAAGTGIGGALQTIGALAAVGGSLYQGYATNEAAKDQARAITAQRQQEKMLNAVEDQRTRQQFSSQIRKQSAQIAERGFSLDSPTALFLGQNAAKELAFASQSVRQTGAARQTELSNAARASRAKGQQALLKGGFSAAGGLLTKAPDLWPELLS